jgi:heptosyltransferase-2
MIAYLAFACTRILFWFIQILPLNAVRKLAQLAAFCGWMVDIKHRKLILRNLKIAFADEYSEAELSKIGRESFFRFFDNSLTAVWAAGHSDEEVDSLYEVIGVTENLVPALEEKKGVMDILFHLGNWELLSRIIPKLPNAKFSTIFQPLKNPHFNRLVEKWRGASGIRLLNRHEGFGESIACLRRGEVVSMLVDQHAGDHGMWIPLFGRMASTTPLPAILARRTGAKIIPVFCRRICPQGSSVEQRCSTLPMKWQIEFGKAISTQDRSEGEIMAEIHERLEAEIRRDPANWFWFHNRWKTPSPNFLFPKYRRGVFIPKGSKLKPFRILIRSTNWLGDAVLTIPAIRAIRSGRPDVHISILTPPKLADLWRDRGFIDEVFTSFDELKGKSFEVSVLLPNSFRSAWEAWRLGIPSRLGYGGHSRSFLLTAICPEEFRAGVHEHDVKDFCGLARWMGGVIENENPILNLPQDVVGRRSSFPTFMTGGQEVRPTVVLHPGAAYGNAKRWIAERFVELVNRFPDKKWIVIGSKDESERNAGIVRQLKGDIEDTTGRLSLQELINLLAKASAVVCNDSGPMHLAAALGTPVVAIFGSTEPVKTGPLGQGHGVIRKLVECSPCFLRECPIDLRCMKAVEVGMVEKALRETLVQRLNN